MTSPPPRRRWFQYSLATMFVVVTVIAIWFALYSRFGWTLALVTGGAITFVAGIAWIFAIVDALANETKSRWVWVAVIYLGQFPGAILYLAYRRPRRIAELKSYGDQDCTD